MKTTSIHLCTCVRMPNLKLLCKEFEVKSSGTKAALIGQLLSFWTQENVFGEFNGTCEASTSKFNFEAVKSGWSKDLPLLRDFNFFHIFCYLVYK